MKVFRFCLPWIGLLIIPLAASADIADQVTDFTLDNGLQVVVIEDHRAPVVVHMLWYRAGSADETAGVSGIAHFLEHLLFKQTKTLESGEFSRVVAKNGGSDNAFTSKDFTAYFQRVAADRLDLMMQMEADRMVNLDLSEEDIVTEREVIIEERNQRVENSPGALFREQSTAALFLNHRYGVPVIGWRHEMEKLNLGDALDFYRQYYAPNNAVLVVAGDVLPDDVRQLAEKNYGPLSANPDLSPRARPQEPPQIAARRLTYRDERVAQPYMTRSYLAPERDPGDQSTAAALTLLAEILGGGQTSVLTQKLQFETSTAVYAAAFYDGLSLDDSSFGFAVVPSADVTLQAAEEALDQALAEFFEAGVDLEQLERIKTQFSASDIYARDNVQGLANSYGAALTSGLGLSDIHAWPDIIQAVTAKDIMAAAKDVLRDAGSVTGWLMKPEEEMQ
ncbi:MAG: pitrilysin family protein [Paracoccaceae bacterium]|nr:peptidase M16 [Marinovum sp.]MDG2294076.1 pitrilysin family protein [Paracoccaceae bacterium]